VSVKDEIMEMPEGKTSEEIDAMMMEGEEGEEELNAEAKLASDALEATEEDSPAEKSDKDEETEDDTTEDKTEESKEKTEEADKVDDVDPKDAVIGQFRREKRDLEIELAEARGALKERQSMPVHAKETVVVKSPLEIAEDAYIVENGDLEGFAMNGTLYREQRAFDDKQTATTTAETESKTHTTTLNQAVMDMQDTEFSAEKMGEGLDVLSMEKFDRHLTRGDLLDIQDMAAEKGLKASLRMYYGKVKDRTLASGTDDAKILENAIKLAKGKTTTQKKTLKTEKDVDDLTTEGDDNKTGDSEQGSISSRLKSFVGDDFFD
jgi:hypothetical protein